MPEASSAVLVAGQGLTGLTTALFLAWYGAPHVLVEREGDLPPAALPIAIHPHTVELFRSAGLEAVLRQAAVAPEAFSEFGCPWSGAGQKPAWLASIEGPGIESRNSVSPCRGVLSAQNVVAALLRARAEVLGSDVWSGTRLIAFEPEAEGIKAILEHPITGTLVSFRAQYLVIAADSQDERRELRSDWPGDFEPGVATIHGPPSFSAQFRSGRAFFAGRAARVLSIPAVVALNLEMQDAHNLAWKLAYVVKGLAGPALLETYEAERKPVVKSVFQHAERRGDIDRTLGGEVPPFANWMSSAGYRSTAVLAEDGDEPGVHDEDSRTPTGSPGMPVRHVALQRGGHDLSTLDLCGGDFVLLAGADGLAWCDAAERAADRLGIDLEAYCIGAGRDLSTRDSRWPAACDLTEAGALLVRPDGYVGWRARAALPHPERVLTEVLARLLSRAEASR